jgi:hypothetical protein
MTGLMVLNILQPGILGVLHGMVQEERLPDTSQGLCVF